MYFFTVPPHKRIERSPHCWACEQDYGPPPNYYGGYHYRPHFHSQQWSGLSRSPDGSQQQVFSGAAASADEGSPASSESQAFSIASAGTGALSKNDNQQRQVTHNHEEEQNEAKQGAGTATGSNSFHSEYQQQQQQIDSSSNKDFGQQLQMQNLENSANNKNDKNDYLQNQQSQLGYSSNNGQQQENNDRSTYQVHNPEHKYFHRGEIGQYKVNSESSSNSRRGDIGESKSESSSKQYDAAQNSYDEQQKALNRGIKNGVSDESQQGKYTGDSKLSQSHSDSTSFNDHEQQHLLYGNKQFGDGQARYVGGQYESSGMQHSEREGAYNNKEQQQSQNKDFRHYAGFEHGGHGQADLQKNTEDNNAQQHLLYDNKGIANGQERYVSGQYGSLGLQQSEKEGSYSNVEQQQNQNRDFRHFAKFEHGGRGQSDLQQNVQDNNEQQHKNEISTQDGAYKDTKSNLDGALSLASQGLQASQKIPESGCSNCDGKGSIAYSNARSNSGSAVALSIGG